MRGKRSALLGVGLFPVLVWEALAGEPPGVPEKPWFPFPELPVVLWYEDFETGAPMFTLGKIDDPPAGPAVPGAPAAPAATLAGPLGSGGKAYLLGEVAITNTDKKGAATKINLSLTKVKIPNGIRLAQLALFANAWVEDPGDLQFTFQAKEKCAHREAVTTAKKWTPITFPLSEVARLKVTDVVTELEVLYIPRNVKTYQKVYLDDILVASGVPKPADILPHVLRARQRVRGLERTTAKDGFAFLPQNQDALRNMLTASLRRKKAKSVLVMGPCPGDGSAWVKALSAAAAKAKLVGYTFIPAEAPDNSPVGGLSDMRALLRYNLDKTQALLVLLVLGYKDTGGAGTPAESARVVIERALAAGCVPLVSLPPPVAALSPTDKPRVETFVNAVSNVCTPKGVTVIEASSALKDVADPLSQGELSAAAADGVAAVSAAALKHLETYLLNRK